VTGPCHWHWDHVDGFADTVEACVNAKVYVSGALHLAELCIWASVAHLLPRVSKSILEFRRVVDVLRARTPADHCYLTDSSTTLMSGGVASRSYMVSALSPSPTTVQRAMSQLGPAIQRGSVGLELPKRFDNAAAVVVEVESGKAAALLAADLERAPARDVREGWSGVLHACRSGRQLSQVFKVSHHGSKNGHEPRVWSDLLEPGPIGVLTHCHQGKVHLPQHDQLPVLRAHTSSLWSTSTTSQAIGDAFDRTALGRAQRLALGHPPTAPAGYGHVRLRRGQTGGRWRVGCFAEGGPV
jgi:hypothetical protein